MEDDKTSEFQVRGEELLRKVKEIIREGNARRIIVKDEKGETYFEIPLTVGVVGALFLPVLAALGAMAALVSNFTLQVVRRDDDEQPEKENPEKENPDKKPPAREPSKS